MRRKRTASCRRGCRRESPGTPASPCRRPGTGLGGSGSEGTPACRRRKDPEQAGPCGRRRFGEPRRRHHREFFPPPFQTEDAGLGVTENPSNDGCRPETLKPIGIVEAAVFSHTEIIPDFFKGENTITSKSINNLRRRAG